MGFQTTVNYNYALGVVGTLAFNDGGMRAAPYNLVSSPVANTIGNAFTLTTAATTAQNTSAPTAGTATAGGTGQFAGILVGLHEYSSAGPTGNPLGATIVLPDNSIGELLTRGFPVVNLPGPANPGDLVTYDPLTGNLNSIPAVTKFTGSIAAGGSAGVNDVLTVSAVSAGQLAVGQLISGSGVAGGTYISSFGTGKGFTGTYNLTSINEQTVSSEAMTAPGMPIPALSITGYITTSAGVDTLHVSSVVSGDVLVGSQIFGTGVAANTVVTAYGSGVGGTGTYTLNTSGQTVFSSGSPGAMTGPSNLFVPHAEVYRYAANTTGGNAIIQLSN